jgi:Dullard-like phosphatase family protein
MSSRYEDTATFLARLSTRVGGAAAPSTSERARSSFRTGAAAAATASQGNGMLTQAQRGSSMLARGGKPIGISFVVNREQLTAAQREQYEALLRQNKNRSPVDPSKYLPLLEPSRTPGRKTLVLDIDETLVHSSYEKTHRYDLHIPCTTDAARGTVTNVYVAFRPHLREFLDMVCSMFEVVIFTASVEIYCRPLMNHLDPRGRCALLWRDHCTNVTGSYVKDLSLLGRDLTQMAIVDNTPHAYLFQTRNGIPCTSWFDNPNDRELLDMLPMLDELARAASVYDVLDVFNASRELTYSDV